MTSTRLLALLLVASSAALTACTGPLPGPTTGTITLDLVGTAPSGRSYRLRDATITVQGPGSVKVWNTEDAPDLTSLSADVAVGDYAALLADGWRLERLDGASATPVAAVLVSDNPARFAVAAHQRTAVPLRFQVDGDEVDMTQGYDITITVDEPSPPVLAVLNGGDPGGVPPRRPSITVYPADGDGDRPPLRTIAGPHTTLQLASDLVVAGDRIIVCERDAIVMFPIGASGDVAPVARIAGPAVGLTTARAIAVSNGEIYVLQNRQVVAVFPLTGNGNIPATRRLIIDDGLLNPFHMVVDHGELYVVDTQGNLTFVKVYPAGAAGNVEPARILERAPDPTAIAVGLAIRGAELFVATGSSIDVLPAGADGPVAPVRSLSPTPGLFQIMEFHDEIYAANPFPGSVQVFSAGAGGTVAPTRTISGPSTRLDTPIAVGVH